MGAVGYRAERARVDQTLKNLSLSHTVMRLTSASQPGLVPFPSDHFPSPFGPALNIIGLISCVETQTRS
jgi:hypothetical protein